MRGFKLGAIQEPAGVVDGDIPASQGFRAGTDYRIKLRKPVSEKVYIAHEHGFYRAVDTDHCGANSGDADGEAMCFAAGGKLEYLTARYLGPGVWRREE
ncbi:MAG: hypothetical protein QM758_13980 [Armatimonas sp.]